MSNVDGVESIWLKRNCREERSDGRKPGRVRTKKRWSGEVDWQGRVFRGSQEALLKVEGDWRIEEEVEM